MTLLEHSKLSDEKQNERLYKEVRYAKSTSLSLKETAEVFRLKKGGKNLATKDYAKHLMEYLDDTKNMASLTISDLNNVLGCLQGTQISKAINFVSH